MGLLSRPRSSIGGTSLFAVTFLSLSTSYAYLHPEGIDRLFGGGTGQPSCSVGSNSVALPCDAPQLVESCDLLMADEYASACPVPTGEEGMDDSTDSPRSTPLDCCQGSLSRGALLRASASTTTMDDPESPVLAAPNTSTASADHDEASGDPSNDQE